MWIEICKISAQLTTWLSRYRHNKHESERKTLWIFSSEFFATEVVRLIFMSTFIVGKTGQCFTGYL